MTSSASLRTPIPTRTSAVASLEPLPVNASGALADVELDVGPPTAHDLLVEVRAVSVNPVDVKVRASFTADGAPKVLGFDAAGVVVAVGDAVTAFQVGDEVFYAGSIARSGSNARLQLVDERITGHKPTSLDFPAAAALPLTAITAWEILFDRLGLDADSTGALLVVGAAGGVGSMVLQLARQLTGMTLIATASRAQSHEWVLQMGAHHVVDPRNLLEEVTAVAPQGVDHVISAFSAGNVETFAQVLKVRGSVVAIDDPESLDVRPLKSRSQTWHWELMFTRPLFEAESTYQRELLDQVAELVDAGRLVTTMTACLSPINAATLTEAHRQVESSQTVGKIVVAAD